MKKGTSTDDHIYVIIMSHIFIVISTEFGIKISTNYLDGGI